MSGPVPEPREIVERAMKAVVLTGSRELTGSPDALGQQVIARLASSPAAGADLVDQLTALRDGGPRFGTTAATVWGRLTEAVTSDASLRNDLGVILAGSTDGPRGGGDAARPGFLSDAPGPARTKALLIGVAVVAVVVAVLVLALRPGG